MEETIDVFEDQAELPESTEADFAPLQEATQTAIPVSEEDQLDLALVRDFIAGRDDAFLSLYAKYEAPLLHY